MTQKRNYNKKSLQNLKPYKKGVSGNLTGGHPRSRSFKQIANEVLNQDRLVLTMYKNGIATTYEMKADEEGGFKKSIIATAVAQAINGEHNARMYLHDLLDEAREPDEDKMINITHIQERLDAITTQRVDHEKKKSRNNKDKKGD